MDLILVFFTILIFFIALFILITKSEVYQSVKKTRSLNRSIPSNGERVVSRWKTQLNNISYEIEKYYKSPGQDRRTNHRITATVKSKKIFNFVITKRGRSPHTGAVNIHEDLIVSTTNTMQLKKLDILSYFQDIHY